MIYFCDEKRHLVCYPYSIENLHKMGKDLGIDRRWYHKGKFPHYDIPKKRFDEIRDKCLLVRPRFILDIVKGKNMNNKLVSIVGRINSGKDTIATYLIENRGFRKESFANSLKDCVSVVFGWDRELLEGVTEESRKWREEKDEFWSKELGRDITPRRVLQEWGTEVVREGFHNNTWVASFKKRMLNHNVTRDIKRFVLTDGRFPNEFAVIKEMGGVIVRVDRGKEPEWYRTALIACKEVRNNKTPYEKTVMGEKYSYIHPSEWAWADLEYDHHIENDGSLLQFQNKIKDLTYLLDR